MISSSHLQIFKSLPRILPNQFLILPALEEVAAFPVAFPGQAAIRVANNIAFAVVQVTEIIAAILRYKVYCLPIVGILVYLARRIGYRLFHYIIDQAVYAAGIVLRLVCFAAAG
jgi:hypothetical protein